MMASYSYTYWLIRRYYQIPCSLINNTNAVSLNLCTFPYNVLPSSEQITIWRALDAKIYLWKKLKIKTRLPHTSDFMTLTNHNLLWQCTGRLKFSDVIFIKHKNEISKFQFFSTLPQ